MDGTLEVRLFGQPTVRRPDGSPVSPHEWRSVKNRDLVRLLAVHHGQDLAVEQVLDSLWPDVSLEKGRASLRTAASQVRKLLGPDAIVRSAGSLRLGPAWVDVAHFRARSAAARRLLADGDTADGVWAAREAAAVAVDVLCADDPYSEWLVGWRDRFAEGLRHTLIMVAEAAGRAGWWRDAVDLAERAVDLDASAETAVRVLMTAYAKLGDTALALRAYQSLREALADELGADPSAETEELHRSLLRGVPPLLAAPPPARADARSGGSGPLVGRDAERAQLAELVRARLRGDRTGPVILRGDAEAGASRLIAATAPEWAELGAAVIHVPPEALTDLSPHDPQAVGAALAAHLGEVPPAVPVVLVVDHPEQLAGDGRALLAARVDRPGPTALVVTCRVEASPASSEHAPQTPEADVVTLAPLGPAAIAALAAAEVGGDVDPALVAQLAHAQRGLAGPILAELARLAGSGRLVRGPRGFCAVPATVDTGLDAHLAGPVDHARRTLNAADSEVLDLLAARGPSSVTSLQQLLPDRAADDVRRVLDQLQDLGVVEVSHGVHRFRHRLLAEAAYAWLRPIRRRALHRQLAAALSTPIVDRGRHWAAAGEVTAAVDVWLAAAQAATRRGALSETREALDAARGAVELGDLDAATTIPLLERVAEVAARLHRFDDAVAVLDLALARADGGDVALVDRLLAARDGVRPQVDQPGELTTSSLPVGEPSGGTGARPGAGAGPVGVRTQLAAVDAASGDNASRVLARTRMLTEQLWPTRQLDEATQVGSAALALADADGRPGLRGAALLHSLDGFVWGGDGAQALPELRRAWALVAAAGTPETRADAALALAFALHETGDPDAERWWASLPTIVREAPRERLWRALSALRHLELGDLGAARADAVAAARGSVETRLGASLPAIVVARALAAQGHTPAAVSAFERVLADVDRTDLRLLLPEVAARAAVVHAAHDLGRARDELSLAVTVAGTAWLPRERGHILLARAAVRRAEGDVAAAAGLVTAAEHAMAAAGLVHQRAEVARWAEQHLGAAGTSDGRPVLTPSHATGGRAAQ